MKKAVIALAAFLCCGCQTLFNDPKFAEFKEKSESLESSYLNKEISYPEYLEKKQKLEDEYLLETRTERKIIEGEKTSDPFKAPINNP